MQAIRQIASRHIAIALLLLCGATEVLAQPAQLDENCIVSVLNRNSQVNKVIVRLDMDNFLPLVRFAAEVDWNFEITLDFTNTNAPRFELDGSHDLFPMYEVYVGDQFIYGYDGVVNGFGVTDLLGFGRDIEDIPNGSGPTTGHLFDVRELP